MRRRVMKDGGSPGSVPASESTNEHGALEWLELAQGTTRVALAERLAQAHLIEHESQSVPPAVYTRRAADED